MGIFLLLLLVGIVMGAESSSINLDDVQVPSDFHINSQNETQIQLYFENASDMYMIVINSED